MNKSGEEAILREIMSKADAMGYEDITMENASIIFQSMCSNKMIEGCLDFTIMTVMDEVRKEDKSMEDYPLYYAGMDNWNRPVYFHKGHLYVDIEPRKAYKPKICTVLNNEFNGEPDMPIDAIPAFHHRKIHFIPERKVW